MRFGGFGNSWAFMPPPRTRAAPDAIPLRRLGSTTSTPLAGDCPGLSRARQRVATRPACRRRARSGSRPTIRRADRASQLRQQGDMPIDRQLMRVNRSVVPSARLVQVGAGRQTTPSGCCRRAEQALRWHGLDQHGSQPLDVVRNLAGQLRHEPVGEMWFARARQPLRDRTRFAPTAWNDRTTRRRQSSTSDRSVVRSQHAWNSARDHGVSVTSRRSSSAWAGSRRTRNRRTTSSSRSL